MANEDQAHWVKSGPSRRRHRAQRSPREPTPILREPRGCSGRGAALRGPASRAFCRIAARGSDAAAHRRLNTRFALASADVPAPRRSRAPVKGTRPGRRPKRPIHRGCVSEKRRRSAHASRARRAIVLIRQVRRLQPHDRKQIGVELRFDRADRDIFAVLGRIVAVERRAAVDDVVGSLVRPVPC